MTEIKLQDLKQGSIRDGFGEGLREAAASNPNVVGVCADLTESVRMNIFAEAFPDRYVEVGVAEQSLVGVAAGLALAGKIPVAASYAVFSPGRSWDQLRVSVCYSNLNVKLIGGHAGLSAGPDGGSHQALEDIAMTRVLPNLVVVAPCDQEEARKATHAIINHPGPAYLRSCRDKSANLTTSETPFVLGKANLLQSGSDITLIACGKMVYQALVAAQELQKAGLSVRVLNMHTIKPIDVSAIVAASQETGVIVTAEEHQMAGGLGSAVAEILSTQAPAVLEMVAVNDTFGESGSADELLAKYHLLSSDIVAAAHRGLARKH